MNNRAINKAIAEFLGWKELDFHLDGKRILGDRPTFSNGEIVSYTVDQYVPDYCNDFNAMHEAKETLNFHQQTDYVRNLMIQHKEFPMTNAFFATARQCAEAFLKTIGKWKE